MFASEQKIRVYINCGPKIYTKESSNSKAIKDLKDDLVKSGEVASKLDEFKLVKVIIEDGATTSMELLQNETLALHYYYIQNFSTLMVKGSYLRLNIEGVYAENW